MSDTHHMVSLNMAKHLKDDCYNTSASQVQDVLKLLDGRWKMMILAHLYADSVVRLSTLQRAIPVVSQKMLVQQLKALEKADLLTKTIYAEIPPRVEYRLTPKGASLEPVFRTLLDWGRIHLPTRLAKRKGGAPPDDEDTGDAFGGDRQAV